VPDEDRRALAVIGDPNLGVQTTATLATPCAVAAGLTLAAEGTARKGIAAHVVSHGNAPF
jgi:hypothetical protein